MSNEQYTEVAQKIQQALEETDSITDLQLKQDIFINELKRIAQEYNIPPNEMPNIVYNFATQLLKQIALNNYLQSVRN